jgi:hypothetical protein
LTYICIAFPSLPLYTTALTTGRIRKVAGTLRTPRPWPQ